MKVETFRARVQTRMDYVIKAAALLCLFSPLLAAQVTTFQLHGLPSEVAGTTNGSVVTPAIGPAGALQVNGTGSLVFAPVSIGAPGTTSAVTFLNCCGNTNNAYYQFTDPAVINLFSPSAGQVTFYMTSRYNLVDRVAAGSRFSYPFDAQDATGKHQFGLNVQASLASSTTPARLYFAWWTGANTNAYWYVPVGTEDAIFGLGQTIKITLAWSGATFTMAVNDQVKGSTVYTQPAAVAVLNIGSQAYLAKSGYNSFDDFLSEFSIVAVGSVLPPPPPPVAPSFTTAPSVSFAVGAKNTFTIAATGSPTPTLSESGALPAGVTFDPLTGILAGNPSVNGTFPVTFTAVNSGATVTQAFTLTVTVPSSLSVFAQTGDLTYCVASKASTARPPVLAVTCRRSGVTQFTASRIANTCVLSVGDVAWTFIFDIQNGVVHYAASVNDRDSVGTLIGNHLASKGDVIWGTSLLSRFYRSLGRLRAWRR